MTPERQKWWDSLPAEEKRVRMDIEFCKKQIKWQKRNLRWVVLTGDECKMIINHNKRVIKDLRKQIGLSPLNVVWDYDEYCFTGNCPCCDGIVLDDSYMEYCPQCGQKLRWK